MRSSVLLVIGAALGGTLAGCGGATSPNEELSVARRRWAQRAPTSYSMVLSRSCECTPEMAGPVLLEVRNGTPRSRTYVTNGAAVPPALAEAFPSVEGLFQVIEAARRQGAVRVEAHYDPTLGYPVRIAIDYDAAIADDEISYSATDLRALVTLDRAP